MAANRFVIVAPALLPSQQNTLTQHFQSSGVGYWHWGSDTWLIATRTLENAVALRGKINQALPGVHVVVLQVTPVMWSMYGPSTWAEWFKASWQ